MALNSFTAQKLYENGILDYVPMDLVSTPIVGAGMQNMTGQQYLSSAMQGNLYNTYGSSYDSFTSNYSQNNINLNSTNIGSKSNAVSNALGFFGIGRKSTAGANSLGVQGIGAKSTAGANGFGDQGIGSKSNINFESSFGGFQDAKDGVSNMASSVAGVPKVVWGLLSFAIGAVALTSMIKGKKKPVTYYKEPSFFSKLNPFKKSAKNK